MGKRIEGLKKFLKEFFVGITYLEIQQSAQQEKLIREDLFLVLTFGDLLGVPILPRYHALRLLPYVIPKIEPWKKRILRERDLTEMKGL